jgi:hypothetical protein
MDYTREKDTDATGDLILEMNIADLASVLIVVDSAAFWGLGDLSQALTPISAGGTIALDWQAFPAEIRRTGKIIRVYAKRQAVGTLKTYINFMGAR